MTKQTQPPDPAFYVPLSSLKLWPDNYSSGDVGLIVKLIATHGFRGAIRLWQDKMVIAGNHTTMALMSLKAQGPLPASRRRPGSYHWPPLRVIEYDGDWYVMFVDCSDMTYTEAKSFAIGDNESARKATRDEQKLAELLVGIYQEDSWLGEATGIDGDELDGLLADLGEVPDFKEYDETIADGISLCKCPTCGHEHAKKD